MASEIGWRTRHRITFTGRAIRKKQTRAFRCTFGTCYAENETEELGLQSATSVVTTRAKESAHNDEMFQCEPWVPRMSTIQSSSRHAMPTPVSERNLANHATGSLTACGALPAVLHGAYLLRWLTRSPCPARVTASTSAHGPKSPPSWLSSTPSWSISTCASGGTRRPL